MDLSAELVAVGAVNGLTYGLLAAGLVLAFRASRVINLAHGQVGAFAAALLAVMVLRWQAPYWTALVVAVAAGAAVAGLLELTIVRRLRQVPPLMTLVATLGAAQVLQLLGAAIAHDEFGASLFPHPPGVPSLQIGALTLPPASVALLALGPLAAAAVVLLLRATRFGLTLRASCDEPDAARALGVPARRYATAAWAIAGALSALIAVLVMATSAAPTAEALGPSLLLRALAAAVLARMSSLPMAVAAGIAVGVVEQVARWHFVEPGMADVVLLGVIAAALLLRRPPALRRVDPAAWIRFAPWSPAPAGPRAFPLVHVVRWAPVAVAFAIAALVPLVASAADELRLATVACAALVGVSVWLVAALAGELSLGQFAMAGVGAATAAAVGGATGNAEVGLAAGALAGATAGALLAAVTARAAGLALALTSLAVAIAAETWMFGQGWALGEGVELSTLWLGPIETSTSAGAYLAALLALGLGVACARSLAAGRFGRRLRAMRDNPAAARAYGVGIQAARLQVLALAGAFAGVAGTLLAHSLTTVTPSAFPVSESIDAVVMAVVGGLAIASGAVLGALLIAVLPAFVDFSAAALAATATGWLALLLYAPGGLAALLEPLRGRLLAKLASGPPATRRESPDSTVVSAALVAGAAAGGRREPGLGSPALLELEGVWKRFGRRAAVADAGLRVAAGEIVALVGPNGAGKTTLLDVVCGLERADSGRVWLAGEEVTRAPAEQRARRGLARSFQDASLFPTLTVEELVLLGADVPGATRKATDRRLRVAELLGLIGLRQYAQTRVHALSTGMRRVAEMAAMLAMQPRLLVLDEPSAGLAQPEADALAGLLLRIRHGMGVAMLVVEHDIGLVATIADRVLVMDAGRIVAAGAAGDVLAWPAEAQAAGLVEAAS